MALKISWMRTIGIRVTGTRDTLALGTERQSTGPHARTPRHKEGIATKRRKKRKKNDRGRNYPRKSTQNAKKKTNKIHQSQTLLWKHMLRSKRDCRKLSGCISGFTFWALPVFVFSFAPLRLCARFSRFLRSRSASRT